MKRISRRATQLSAALCLFGALSTTSFADEPTWFGETADGEWFVGLRAGAAQSGEFAFSDATNAGILLGYQFSRPVGFNGSSSIEFEFTTSTSDGNIGRNSEFSVPGNWDVDTFAVYFAYRTPGTVYFKGKGGVIKSDINVKLPGQTVGSDDASLALGVGLGLRLLEDTANVELEFTGASGDNDIDLITLGGTLLF
ncbi:MAG: outer membrane beta-barrel protein [Gammaproteobacteria bacterium]|nr:outer membrane beta-barrel protein [Gammaproteobacteria bacterium]